MLRELHIANLAVIADATVELQDGLNVFTGATGAGKSLLLGAFELLLGLRAGGEKGLSLIRAGCDEARVTGLFEFHDDDTAHAIATILDRPVSKDEPLLITRRLFATGRSSASANGAPATAAMLRDVGERLVELHGQHDQQSLLKPAQQRRLLDAFAQCDPQRDAFTQSYQHLREQMRRRDELAASRDLRQQRQELLAYQIDEIDSQAPAPGDFGQARQRYEKLSHIGQLQQELGHIQQTLCENDPALLDTLQSLSRSLETLSALDEDRLETPSGQLADAVELLRDASLQVGRYLDDLDIAPGELDQASKHLDALNTLIHKYARDDHSDDPIAAVLAQRDEFATQLASLQHDSEDLSHLDDAIETARAQLTDLGAQLTKARTVAARAIEPLVEAHLAELGMGEASFRVAIDTKPADDATSPTGCDDVEFLVATNPGQPARPLRQIASGGEISRLMLALKSVLAAGDSVGLLVFDEIDANIGGRLGSVIGQKLRSLTRPDAPNAPPRQVLCITHLAQLAAYGDHHLHIAKAVTGDSASRETHTTVRVVSGDSRVAELADMLAGQQASELTQHQARDLLAAAQKPWKP